MQRPVPRRRVGWSREPAPALELSALLLLPQDCLTAVLAALPPRALATCCGASRSLRQAASDPKLWAAHCRDQWPEDEWSWGWQEQKYEHQKELKAKSKWCYRNQEDTKSSGRQVRKSWN